MNAANAPLQSPSLGSSSLENERRAHEPSMEEILASIRRIIADDDALPLSRPASEQRSPPRLFETNVTPLVAPASVTPATREAAPASAERPAAPVAIEPPSPARAERGASPDLDDIERASFDEVGRELSRIDAAQQEFETAGDERAADSAPCGHAEPEAESFELRPALAASEAAHEPEAQGADAPGDRAADAPGDRAADAPGDRAADAPGEQGADAPEEQGADAPEEQGADAPEGHMAPGMIMSAEANASVASAFQALSTSVQLASSEAIERQVRDMLRPMLKQWLDDNLPVMVERMVRAEIERVARGGR